MNPTKKALDYLEMIVMPPNNIIFENKIANIEYLPSYNETRKILEALGNSGWLESCRSHNKYLIETEEFVRGLSILLRALPKPIIEVCAGRGKLSYWLRKYGVEIIPTDDYSWRMPRHPFVIRLSILDAIEKFKPRTILGSWIPANHDLGLQILDNPYVQYYIDISEGIGADSSWTHGMSIQDLKELASTLGYSVAVLGELSRLALSMESKIIDGILYQKNLVVIFYKKILPSLP